MFIKYDKNPITFIKNALSPAKDVEVYILDEKKKENPFMIFLKHFYCFFFL